MVVPGVPLATRRKIRPYKLGLVAVIVAGVCLYGGFQSQDHHAATFFSRRRLQDTAPDNKPTEECTTEKKDPPTTTVAALNAAGLVYMFLALAIVCDEFFVPALDLISEKLNLSPDIAGATFMAAGGSAPEFFTSMVGAFSVPPSDVGIATIVGSAVFNVLFVIGACGLAAPKILQLTWYPLARDSTFYIVHLVALCVWLYDGEIQWWESLVQFFLYVAYCVFMVYSESVEAKLNDRLDYSQLDTDGDGFISKKEAQQDAEVNRRFDGLDQNKDGKLTLEELKSMFRTRRKLRQASAELNDEADPDSDPVNLSPPFGQGCRAMVYWFFSLPLLIVLVLTVPDCRREGCWKSLFPITFILSILWVAVFSYYMVGFSEVVGDWTGIDTRILAMTLIASGTSVPDLLTSVIVTLQGNGDMAISSSIGSNIFDVTVGLPVPWLLNSLYTGRPILVNTTPETMGIQIGSLIMMLLLVVLSIKCCKWVLSAQLGSVMLVLYVAFMTVTIWQIMQEPPQCA